MYSNCKSKIAKMNLTSSKKRFSKLIKTNSKSYYKKQHGGENEDKVYIVSKARTPILMGNINYLTMTVNVIPTPTSTVNDFNNSLLQFMLLNPDLGNLTQYSKYTIIGKIIRGTDPGNDIIGEIIACGYHRKYTLVYIKQTSERGYRYLCYINTKMQHSSEAFGGLPSIEHIIKNDLDLKLFIKKQPTLDDIDTQFGI